MEDLAVIHMDLMANGGGEAVCMNVLEALQVITSTRCTSLTEVTHG